MAGNVNGDFVAACVATTLAVACADSTSPDTSPDSGADAGDAQATDGAGDATRDADTGGTPGRDPLIGFTGADTPELLLIDPADGSSTLFGQLEGVCSTSFVRALDAAAERFYLLGKSCENGLGRLFTADASNGEILYDVAGGSLTEIAIGQAGRLIGLMEGANSALVDVNPETGETVPIATIDELLNNSLALGGSAFDGESGLWFIQHFNVDFTAASLLTLDTDDGSVISDPPLEAFIANLEVANDGSLVALCEGGDSLCGVDTETGVLTLLLEFPTGASLGTAMSTASYGYDRYYQLGNVDGAAHLYTIDPVTRELLFDVVPDSSLATIEIFGYPLI